MAILQLMLPLTTILPVGQGSTTTHTTTIWQFIALTDNRVNNAHIADHSMTSMFVTQNINYIGVARGTSPSPEVPRNNNAVDQEKATFEPWIVYLLLTILGIYTMK